MGPLRSQVLACLGAALLAFGFGGERPPTDPRFATPESTLRTFWRSVEQGSPEHALECFEGIGFQRTARLLLRLPSLTSLEIRDVRVEPAGTERVLIRYQVRYRLRGADQTHAFRSADELLRVRGQWRIQRPMPSGEGARPGRTRKTDLPPPIFARGGGLGPGLAAGVGVDPAGGAC